jgi:hypothetical protein
LTKRVIREVEPTGRQSRPADTISVKPYFEPGNFEGTSIENVIVGVNPFDQPIFDELPIRSQPLQGGDVNRDAMMGLAADAAGSKSDCRLRAKYIITRLTFRNQLPTLGSCKSP